MTVAEPLSASTLARALAPSVRCHVVAPHSRRPRAAAATETYKADVSKLTSSIASVQQQMAGLKQALYGKFKDSINLEDD